jgi:predicted RNA-binding Zn-ribbon protein involved in translation (DUF1610 family)
MTADIKMDPHIVCPSCGDDEHFRCEHILAFPIGRRFGPWHCQSCGHAIVGTRTADGIDIEPSAERKIATIDVLVLKPQKTPVYFIVEGMRFEGGRDHDPLRDEADSKQFFYEEHSCPTNWFKPVMVYHDGDADPHGLIEFVATRDDAAFPPDESYGPNDRDRAFVDFIKENAIRHRLET